MRQVYSRHSFAYYSERSERWEEPTSGNGADSGCGVACYRLARERRETRDTRSYLQYFATSFTISSSFEVHINLSLRWDSRKRKFRFVRHFFSYLRPHYSWCNIYSPYRTRGELGPDCSAIERITIFLGVAIRPCGQAQLTHAVYMLNSTWKCPKYT